MATFVMLGKYTKNGMVGFKNLEERVAQSKASLQKAGMQLQGMWLTMGRYDLLAVIDAPDEETMATWLLAFGARDILVTETMRAFDEQAAIALAKRLP